MIAEITTQQIAFRGESTMLPSRPRSAVLAAVTVAASALMLSACGSSSDSASSAPSSSASSAPSSSASTPSSSASASSSSSASSSAGASGSSAGSAGSGSTSGGVDAGSGAKATGKANGAASPSAPAGMTRCHTQDLALSFETGGDAAPDMTSDQQQQTGIAVRNDSGHTCAVGGFPGVDLTGGSVTWSLTRKAESYQAITLHPGDTTDFSITFLPDPHGKWTPKTVTVTPPNETTSKTLTWPWGPVMLQDGATHPGTYVGPIG